MKYLFVIQGEGRGHLTQSLALSNLLRESGHSVTEVLVGRCKNREIPSFFSSKIGAPITLFDSPTFDYGSLGKRGSLLGTVRQNASPSKLKQWGSSISLLRERINGSDADVVVNFYELLLGVTNLLSRLNKPIVSIAHQLLIDHTQFTTTTKGSAQLLRLNNAICAYGSRRRLALSFYPMESCVKRNIEVVPPLLRPEISQLIPTQGDYMLGYMLNPAYLDEVVAWKRRNPAAKVHIFWDRKGAAAIEEYMDGLWLHQINDVEFLRLMCGCRGFITTAGFESVCEALYLGKPVLMIPAHLEQQINAADAERVGAGATAAEFDLTLLERAIENYSANTPQFREWVDSANERILKALTEI